MVLDINIVHACSIKVEKFEEKESTKQNGELTYSLLLVVMSSITVLRLKLTLISQN